MPRIGSKEPMNHRLSRSLPRRDFLQMMAGTAAMTATGAFAQESPDAASTAPVRVPLGLDGHSIRAMLWNPERLLHALYELRNQGLISKISEIDNIRQFTTKHTLARVVEQIVSGGN